MHANRRCENIVYGIMGLIGAMVAALLIKLLFFSGLFTPLLALNSAKTIEMEVNTSFQDPGIRARFCSSDYSDEVKIEGNLNMKKPGTYTPTYIFDKYQKTVECKVNVIDTTPSKISLKGGSSIRVFENGSFQESGYQASDNYNGDVSKSVGRKGSVDMKKQGTHTLIYTAKDVSGSTTSVKRGVQVCADPANTKLYYDHDNYDNIMEEQWFNKSKDYQRTTGAKNEKLLKKHDSYHQGPKGKVIHLTFNEGGNNITYIKQIAEVLKKNDVQATYSLTKNYIKTEADFIRQLVQDGNVIGNHGWHHYNMTTLANASSIDKFVAETTETEKTYTEVTGQPMKKAFRFSKGGSNEHTMKLVKDLGYSNCSRSHVYYNYASDVSGSEALKTMMEYYHEGATYLLHPSNKGNYEAMDTLIKNMKDLDYDFKTVDTIPSDVQRK